jgi:hypothetical protein
MPIKRRRFTRKPGDYSTYFYNILAIGFKKCTFPDKIMPINGENTTFPARNTKMIADTTRCGGSRWRWYMQNNIFARNTGQGFITTLE